MLYANPSLDITQKVITELNEAYEKQPTIAETIKENNIIEYVLFMWQTEDMVRGFQLDLKSLKKTFQKILMVLRKI